MNYKVLFFLIFITSFLTAQTAQTQRSLFNDVERESPKYKNSMEEYYKTRSMLRTVVPQILEKEVEDSKYIVGPGDQLSLYIYGELETAFDFTILPEGQVYIPTIGKVKLCGLTLKEAKSRIIEKTKDYYLNADISVNLVSLRKFRVYLVGDVNKQGTYFVQGSNRVADILEISGGVKEWADMTAVELRHMDGSVDDLNLQKFYHYGDKKENPVLNSGDMIIIKPIDMSKPFVFVEMNLSSYKKIYPIFKDESVITFLKRINAFNNKVELTNIVLQRDSTKYVIDIVNNNAKYKNFKLESSDHLVITYLENKIYIQGQVRRPGGYPFVKDRTANDYVSDAGVLESSNPEDIIIIRKKDGTIVNGANNIVYRGDTIVVPRKTREDVQTYIAIFVPIITMAISLITLFQLNK